MRISSNQVFTSLNYNLQRLNEEQVTKSQEIATGQIIRKPGDAPNIVGEMQDIESQKRLLSAYKNNQQRAAALSEYTETNLAFIQNIGEEGLSALSLAVSDNDPGQVDEQAKRLQRVFEQIFDTANTRYNGSYVFSGSTIEQIPFRYYQDENGDPQKPPTINASTELVEGTRYRIQSVGGITEFSNSGAADNNVGTEFTYTEDEDNPAVFDGAVLEVLAPDITESTQNNLVIGQRYRIESVGSSSNFTASGAANNNVGTEFTYNGTELPTWDGAVLRPLEDPISEEVGDRLVNGQTYRILSVGTNSDFTTSGASTNTLGAEFTYNGTEPANWDGATLIPVFNVPNFDSTSEADLVTNSYYEIVTAGSGAEDFTGSGAPANTVGTEFAYNGTSPTWDGAEIRQIQPDYDNPITAGPLVDGKLYMIGTIGATGDFSTGNALVPGGGVPTNTDGEVFRFAAGQTEVFDPDTVLYEFVPATETRSEAHPPIQYVGSSTVDSYTVGSGTKINPKTEASDNENLAEMMNRILELKDSADRRSQALINLESAETALIIASNNNDSAGIATAEDAIRLANLQIDSSKDALSDGIGTLEDSQDNLVAARSGISTKLIAINLATIRDEEAYNTLENRISSQVDTDQATAIVELTQASQTYQAALQSASLLMQQSLLNYI